MNVWSEVDRDPEGKFRIALADNQQWSLNHGVGTRTPGDCDAETLRKGRIQMYDDKWINSHFLQKDVTTDSVGTWFRLEPSHAPGWYLAVEEHRVCLRNDVPSGDESLFRFESA